MNLSECIIAMAKTFGLSNHYMQLLLRVSEGELNLWRRAVSYIPKSEHDRIHRLYVLSENWKSSGYIKLNPRIHEETFGKISIFLLMCKSVVEMDKILFIAGALEMDATIPKKVSNTTAEYMERQLKSFMVVAYNSDMAPGYTASSDTWVSDAAEDADEPGKLFAYMAWLLLGKRPVLMAALMKGISALDGKVHTDLLPAIMIASTLPDVEVQDYIINCVDNSNDPERLMVLKTMEMRADYLEEYRTKVIEQFDLTKTKVSE